MCKVLEYHFIEFFFQNFIRGEQPMSSALLGVSSLVSSYCKENTECQDLPEVQAIITQYEELLGSNCAAIDSAEEDKVILALKVNKEYDGIREIFYFVQAFSMKI